MVNKEADLDGCSPSWLLPASNDNDPPQLTLTWLVRSLFHHWAPKVDDSAILALLGHPVVTREGEGGIVGSPLGDPKDHADAGGKIALRL
jgi:hypothetical protein